MKFSKLTKKLLLSALSLGLAVVTLTTTTYAWYTSNTDVAASGSGSTSGSTNDSSLLISNALTGTYGPSTEFINDASDLLPLQYKEGSFYSYGVAEATNTGFIKFTLYFKISEAIDEADTPIYLTSLVITNKTATLPAYDNLSSGDSEGLPTSAYTIDAVRALDMVVDNGTAKTAYDLSNLMPESGETAYKASTGFGSNTPDAIAYYNAVMNPETPLTAEMETAEFANDDVLDYTSMDAVGSIAASETTTSVTFYIYLNGWDQYCFDACRGQSFDIAMNFSTNKPTATPEAGE